MIKYIVRKKWFRIMLSYIPIIGLGLTTLSTVYYYFLNDSYYIIYDFISMFWGFSVFSLPAYFYIAYVYDMCSYTKYALWGLAAYVFINFAYAFFNMIGISISESIYLKVLESMVISTLLIISLICLIKLNVPSRDRK
jgi:hypothetical protein